MLRVGLVCNMVVTTTLIQMLMFTRCLMFRQNIYLCASTMQLCAQSSSGGSHDQYGVDLMYDVGEFMFMRVIERCVVCTEIDNVRLPCLAASARMR